MNRHVGLLLLILALLSSRQALGQDEFFHELSVEKTFLENEEWEFAGEVTWKNQYNEAGWRRWGVSLFGERRLFDRFRLKGGLNGYYTLNSRFKNFFELRPLLAVSHHLPLGANISLQQRLKVEWRFFYDEGEAAREDYRRIRYQLGLDIPLSQREPEASWTIRPYVEWYFIGDPATFERFPNERDYGFMLIKPLANEHVLTFGYRLETFYNVESERGNGHLIIIGYSL